MEKQVTLNDATKSDDWKCIGGINAGDDSYRVYQSEKTGEQHNFSHKKVFSSNLLSSPFDSLLLV